MASNQFDPKLIDSGGNVWLEGECTRIAVTEPASPFPPPLSRSNFVVDPREAFTVSVAWEIRGYAAPPWVNGLDPNWNVQLFVESQGPGPERLAGTASVPAATAAVLVGGVPVLRYTANIVVPAGTLAGNIPPGSSGIYNPTVCIFLNSDLGEVGYDITGFHSGPTIKAEVPL